LDGALRLLHPFVPYVTEETWQQLRRAFTAAGLGISPAGGWSEALMIADWPRAGVQYPDAAADFEQLRELVRRIRVVRAEHGVEPGQAIVAHLAAASKTPFYRDHRAILAFLARLDDDKLEIAEALEPPANVVTIASGEVACYLPLAGLVNVTAERGRLEREMAEAEAQIARISALLSGPFAEKAPEAVVEKERDRLAQLQATQREVSGRLVELGRL
jgi:valyl-tRNA synthetase